MQSLWRGWVELPGLRGTVLEEVERTKQRGKGKFQVECPETSAGTRQASSRWWCERCRDFRFSPTLVLTLAIPLIYAIVFGSFLFREGDSDWDQLLSFHELSLWNSKLFGIAKQWNPLMRGGMSLAGDPQVPIFSASMILTHAVDPAAAIKIASLLFLLLGGLGTWLLARDLRFDRLTSALAGSLFAGNGFILSRFSHGHIVFLGTLGLPLWLWAARRSLPAPGEEAVHTRHRLLLLVLAGGVFFALSTDGAPMTILLLLTWVGLDASVLAWQKRSLRPILFFAGSVIIAVALDAIYYFPLAANAVLFPRVRAPVFIDPLVFFWFLLLPVGGKVLPAPANGHEFSVYIGPVIAYLLIRYRHETLRAFPDADRRRFLIVSGLTFVLGLGAWRALARWMPPGPFDLLHLLPGFVAIGIPGRFWGYLALPLALGSAVAIRQLGTETTAERPRRVLWTALFVFTLGFQAISLVLPFVDPEGRLIVKPAVLPRTITTIRNVVRPRGGSQAAQLQPTIGLMNAYNGHDYLQGKIVAGSGLVLEARDRDGSSLPVTARWNGWNRIDLALPAGGRPGALVTFNQNFHPSWTSAVAIVTRNQVGNLCLRLHAEARPGAMIGLTFRDVSSILGTRVSRFSALAVVASGLLLAIWHFLSAA
jgi:hypothetical protein